MATAPAAPTSTASICPECGERADTPGTCARDGAARLPLAADPMLGVTVDRFVITGLLGSGGAGRVYRGLQPTIGARVAIKVLSAQAAEDRTAVERFFAEARAVNLIRHEGIVKVLDLAFLPDGRPYIVMEHLDGAPLARVIARQGPLPLATLAAFVIEVLDAVGAAHTRGVVHRDLKPANLFVTPGGHARVLDFGLAKLAPELDGRAATTRSGLLLGTPHYMAPEQADARPADHRADLYAVGVILYEGVTGVRPFEAPSLFELLRQQLEDTAVPPSKRRADLPGAYEKVIKRALDKDPERRFQSAAEMAEALAAASASLPAAASAPLRAEAEPIGSAAASVDPVASTMASPRPARAPRPTAPPTHSGRSTTRVWATVALLAAVAAVAVVAVRGLSRRAARTAVVVTTDAAPATTNAAAADAGTGAGPGTLAAGSADAAPVAPAVSAAPADAGPSARRSRPDAGPRAALHVTRTPDAGARTAPLPHHPDDDVDPLAAHVEPLALPGPPDPARFDLAAYLPQARAAARQMFPDAELIMFYGSMLDPTDGTMDLTRRGHVGYMFRSPQRSVGDVRCYVQIDVSARSLEVTARLPTNPGDACAWPVVPAPRCTPAQVMKRAQAAGAKPELPGYVRFILRKTGPIWEFSEMGGSFSTKIADDC